MSSIRVLTPEEQTLVMTERFVMISPIMQCTLDRRQGHLDYTLAKLNQSRLKVLRLRIVTHMQIPRDIMVLAPEVCM